VTGSAITLSFCRAAQLRTLPEFWSEHNVYELFSTDGEVA
jgi:hypothetical protein